MPAVAIVIAIAVDVAATAGAESVIASIAAGTIFASEAGVITTVGYIAAGAIGGLVSSEAAAAITGGNPLTAGLEGLAGGALSAGLASGLGGGINSGQVAYDAFTGEGATLGPSFTQNIVNSVANATSLPTSAVSAVLKAVQGAGTGAGKALLSGQDPATGALGGAISGGVGAGLGAAVSGSGLDISAIANDTGLPKDVVQAVVQGLGQAATGSLAGEATGGNVGLSALQGFASGFLPGALKSAEDAAKSAYDSIVGPAQQSVAMLQQQYQDYLDSYKVGLENQVTDAQTKYQAALDAVNQSPWAVRIVNGEAQPPMGPRGSSNLFAYESAKPTADAYQASLQNLEAVSQQTSDQWNQLQQQVSDQFQTAAQPYLDQIQNAQNAPEVKQAYDSTLQQVSQAAQALNPIGTAEATPVNPATDPFTGNYPGFSTVDQALSNVPDPRTSFVAQGPTGQWFVIPKTALNTDQALNTLLNSGYAIQNATQHGTDVTLGASPAILVPAAGAGGSDSTGGPAGPSPFGTSGSEPGTSGVNTTPQDNFTINNLPSTYLFSLAGLTPPGPQGPQSAAPSENASSTNNRGDVSPQDRAIMQLAGLTAPPRTGPDQSAGSSTGTTAGFGGTSTGAGPPGTGTGAGGTEGTGGGGEGGTGSGGGGGGTPLDFASGAVPNPSQAPLPGQQPGPGSQALAQALSVPSIGYSPGGDIFGTLGKRTPVWNKSSLRAEDTSGVTG